MQAEKIFLLEVVMDTKSKMAAFCHARTCYHHLAGFLGVALTHSLCINGYLKYPESGKREFILTQKGEQFFMNFGLPIKQLKLKRRSFSRACLDRTERRYHLAGALGDALTSRMFSLGWIERYPSSRAVQLTHKGKIGFQQTFHLNLSEIHAAEKRHH